MNLRAVIITAVSVTLFSASTLWSYDYGIACSRGDTVVVLGPETAAAEDTPEGIATMMARWAGNGYTSVVWREMSYVFGSPHHDELLLNPLARPATLGSHWRMTDVAQAFDGITVAQQAAVAEGLDFWVWEEIWNDGTPAGSDPPYWPFQLSFLNEHPEVQVVDPNGDPQYGVREMAYPIARQQKIDEFEYLVTNFPVKNLLIVLRTEMALTMPAPETGDSMGFNQPVVDDMQSLYGVDILTDARFDAAAPGFDINDAMVENWRDLRGGYLTQFLREVRAAMDVIDPTIKIGIYCTQGEYLGPPFGNMKQQWRTWVDEGLVDRIMMGGHMGSCVGGDCGTGYLSDPPHGIGILPITTVKAYITASSNPGIEIVKGSSTYDADADGNLADSGTEDKAFAQAERDAQIQQVLNEYGYVGYIEQDFDDFPTFTVGRANGGFGSSQYFPSVNSSAGWWEDFGEEADLTSHIQDAVFHGPSGKAAMVTRGNGVLSARRSVSPGYSVDAALSSGYATFEFWVCRKTSQGELFVNLRNFNQAVYEVGIWIKAGTGLIYKKVGATWVDTGVALNPGVWHKVTYKLDLDSKQYSVYTGENSETTVATGLTWTATTYFDYVQFYPNIPDGNIHYIDDVKLWWHPTQWPVSLVCGGPSHPYPNADFNGDCRVNIEDVRVLASSWLDCSDPDCD